MFQTELWALDAMQAHAHYCAQVAHVLLDEDVSDVDTPKNLVGIGNRNLDLARHAQLRLQNQMIH